MMYTCIHCLAPSPSLYRQYSTSSSVQSQVKLTRCTNCNEDVDRYIEHEALLVGIDLVLLRTPAYRHLFFNRTPFATFCLFCDGEEKNQQRQHQHTNDTEERSAKHDNSRHTQTKRAFVYIAVAVFLDAFHKHEALSARLFNSNTGNNHVNTCIDSSTASPPISYLHLILSSVVEHFLFLSGVLMFAWYCSSHSNTPTTAASKTTGARRTTSDTAASSTTTTHLHGTAAAVNKSRRSLLFSRLFLAVFVPTWARFISIFVLIWEDTSPTIRILGSLFVLLFQCASVHTVMEQQATTDSQQRRRRPPTRGLFRSLETHAPGAGSILSGVLLRSLVMTLLLRVLFHADDVSSAMNMSQCSGYELPLSPSYGRMVFGTTTTHKYYDVDSTHGLNSICLT